VPRTKVNLGTSKLGIPIVEIPTKEKKKKEERKKKKARPSGHSYSEYFPN
jgi:Glu-tRNA(Gln) amidotransferase subunit E-like FAD-binding protein